MKKSDIILLVCLILVAAGGVFVSIDIFECKCNAPMAVEMPGSDITAETDILFLEPPPDRIVFADAGDYIFTGRPRTLVLTVSEYNKISCDSLWEMIDVYYKQNARTSLWKGLNGDVVELIGVMPPATMEIY